MREVKVGGTHIRNYPLIDHDITENIVLMINAIKKEIKYKRINLVCTGSSGLYVATFMKAYEPKMFTIVYIRKAGEDAHTGMYVTKKSRAKTFLWVDDFVASGATYARCNDKLIQYTGKKITHCMTLGCGDDKRMEDNGVQIYFKGN